MNIKHIAAGITAAVIMGAMSVTAFAAQKESPLQMAAIAIDDSLSTAWGENRNVSSGAKTETSPTPRTRTRSTSLSGMTASMKRPSKMSKTGTLSGMTRSKCSTPIILCSTRSASRTDI